MTRSTLLRLGATVAFAGVTLAACSGTSSATASPAATTAPTVAASPSTATESTAPSTEASSSPEASASSPASAGPSGSPEARTVQVQAGDDRFMNAPIDPTPGTVLTFRNVGQQAHEMVVVRRNDDATAKQTFDNISKLNPADLMKFVTVVGVLAADPGQEAQGQITLDQPGDYAIVDLLPVGTTTAPASPDPSAIPSGIPNFTKGLVGTFSVAAPEAS
jgi:plastocyanin